MDFIYRIAFYERYMVQDNNKEIMDDPKVQCKFIKREVEKTDKGVKYYYLPQSKIMMFTDIVKDNIKTVLAKNLNMLYVYGRKKSVLIEARNPEKALAKFQKYILGANVGGVKLEDRAVWIDKSNYIIEYPKCILMQRDKNKFIICGEFVTANDFKRSLCVVEQEEIIDNNKCPIIKFMKKIEDYKENAEDIGGFKFIRKEIRKNVKK